MELYRIQTIDDLNYFLGNHKKISKDILMDLVFFDKAKNKYYSDLINETKNACGCETGTVFMILSIIFVIGHLISNFPSFNNRFFTHLFISFIFIFTFSMFGKMIGLIVAKLKLKMALKQIKENLARYYI